MKRIRAPEDDEERDQGAVLKSIYDALNIKLDEIDHNRIQMKYWQFFSSPWASSMENEERHLELTRYGKILVTQVYNTPWFYWFDIMKYS